MLELRSSVASHPPRAVDATGGRVTFGRKQGLVDVLVDGKKISKRHCSVLMADGKCFLEDESSNGTFVNDEKVKAGRREIVPGDVIRFPGDDGSKRISHSVPPPAAVAIRQRQLRW